MALDGIFLNQLMREMQPLAVGARVDRIAQPSREEIVLHLRRQGWNGRLLLSAAANSPRIHFTAEAPENPKAPPMFCMLLRKHLGGAKLTNISQLGLDRILHLRFETFNELGDRVELTLAVEIMGRHSNIILVGQDGKILDAVKRIDEEQSSVRQILPGMAYLLPPPQDKLSVLEADADQLFERMHTVRDGELSRVLMGTLQGISPIVARELAHFATHGVEMEFSQLREEQLVRLRYALERLIGLVRRGEGTPTMVVDESGKPREFSFMEIHQYGISLFTRSYGSYSELLDAFYLERDRIDRMRQRSHDLLRLLVNLTERISRKLAAQREELTRCGERERLRIYGDLINSNLYQLQKGDRVARLQDFYDPGLPTVEIPLDPRLTPVQNAQKYYADYRKADTTERMLTRLIAQSEEELAYLDTVFDELARARSEGELTVIRQELASQGYLRENRGRGGKPRREEKLSPLRYRSSDGYTILSGRNNLQNDRLTLKESRNYDVWFHTQKIPGSHTVVVSQGGEIPDRTLEEAAVIAAYNSRARESTRVPVDYTYIKFVKKPVGAKPGMVIYDSYKTAIVTPDEALVQKLLEKS